MSRPTDKSDAGPKGAIWLIYCYERASQPGALEPALQRGFKGFDNVDLNAAAAASFSPAMSHAR